MKKLILVVLFALIAGACAGSDDTSSGDETTGDASSEATADQTDGASEAGADDDPLDSEPEDSDLPLPPEVVQVQDRDCVHAASELAGSDDDAAEAEDDDTEVVLPPDEKPTIEDDYLGSFDELQTIDLIEGTGDAAVPGATVSLRYVGVLADDATEFDASWNRGEPITFVLDTGAVIPGWDQGIEGMQVGGRRVLQIPSDLAYGSSGQGAIGPDADLLFVVDLVAVADVPEPSPPIDDQYLGSFGELQTVDLVEGEGCEARVGDIVSVNYVGVDAGTAEQFDSSWTRGETFPLIVGRSQVIDGWNQGLIGMKVGGERILQIPGALAYDDSDLVFRVHLEELIEAPVAHTVEFEGDAPDEVEVTTLVEGTGDATAEAGDIIDVNIVVMLYNSNTIVESTWQQGTATQLALQGGALLPALEESIAGTAVGETRQIVIPASIAYPEGVPAQSGIAEDDALVFILDLIGIVG